MAKKKKKLKDLYKKHKGRVKLLYALPYEKNMVYVRMIGEDLFMWDVVYGGEIYSSYIIITPEKGKKKLEKKHIAAALQMCYAGATATIDMKMGKKLDKKMQENVKIFEESRKKLLN